MGITILKYVCLIIGAYLIGNISFSRILAKTQKDDITTHGSGNPGSMNMLRTHGISMGTYTMILDMIKGAIPSLIGFFLFGGFGGGMEATIGLYVGGTCAVIGHVFPVFYKFKGGKGVATAAGLACVAHPFIVFMLFLIFILLLLTIKIGSMCSLIVVSLYVIYDCVILSIKHNFVCLSLVLFLLILIIFMHRSNIKKLIHKQENIIDLHEALNKDKERFNHYKHKDDEIIENSEEQPIIEIEEKDIVVDDDDDVKE